MMYTWLRDQLFFILFVMQQVIIHMKGINNTEYDLIVDDVDTPDHIDGVYIDPDIQLCNHYNIDYDQVNCIELAWCWGIESLLNV